jgi:signal transduction histidine kinase
VRALNGEETVVSYNAATFYDRDRKLQGVFAAARDITERKRVDGVLQEKNIELEHATRMKSEFLATMSHELRTPLNAIIGFSEALKDGLMGKLGDGQHECVVDIFSSGQHLLSLINDILDLSKVEAGMMALELEAVDLKGLLNNSLTIVREKAAAQRISLELETGADLGQPQLDMRKTKQIAYNLLSNAVKFSSNAGKVKVRACRVPRKSVGVLTGPWPVHSFPLADSEYGEFLELSVTDTGIGISPQNMGKLFQAFSQIDSSLARKFEGTGLGLAMVKQLAELHGGTVAVASEEGKGACFAVWLPMRDATDKRVARVAMPTGPIGGASANGGIGLARKQSHTILVADDDPKAVEVIASILPSPAFSVLRAYSGGEAIALAKRLMPDLLVLDLLMPNVTGFDVIEALRHDPRTARIPVVVVPAMRLSAQDRAALGNENGRAIHIIEKAQFNSAGILNEIGRALRGAEDPHGTHPDH